MNVITVTQLNTYIKSLIDGDMNLRKIYVVGEISNFKHYCKSGHMYLTLKDDCTQIKAVMFASYAERVKFKPEDGIRVICRGRVAVYDKDGAYQLYIEDMQPDGVGALSLAFEQLKEKLSKEGLFDACYKKPIPQYPAKIGVATSNMGAAVEDIKIITKRRYPLAEIVIAPTIVQGDKAPADIVHSIRLLDSMEDIDVIIVGRGGGSLEDLWAFNTEEVARAVFSCKTPIISAVGHETDFTICDFAADLRAETPSAAAENAVPDINVLISTVKNYSDRITFLLKNKLEYEYQRFDYIVNDSILGNTNDYFENHYDILDTLKNELIDCFANTVSCNKQKLGVAAGKLNALSPLAVLSRGYCVAVHEDNVVKSVADIKSNDKIALSFCDGKAVCTVNEVNKNGNDI